MLHRSLISAIAVLFTAFLTLPTVVSACAVCFGSGGGNFVRGFTWGVLLLLLLPFALMTAFITVIARASRRQKPHE